ncbi:hypothetical protein [Spiroplasma endosymbiont of Glossina fuscipes fuscipes]|uniref:hypothetical protein n=1 Tax=Spiroplasma endosymbiont of Glossina fuscipes fuscipes TaxID=2004463 RepID=UPI003CF53DB5
MTITESIKFDKLQQENELLKKELEELKQQQLYKEDFTKQWGLCSEHEDFGTSLIKWASVVDEIKNSEFFETLEECSVCIIRYILDDNSKYDKLPSKDVK